MQVWFKLSDEGVEDSIYDSYAMRKFVGLDFAVEQVPDATTLLHFRHLLEQQQLGEQLLAAQNKILRREGWIMRGGSIVDATLIAAPSSTKDATASRDPEMHQTKKGNQWYFGMNVHIGVDAATGYVHPLTCTAANVHDLDKVPHLVRDDDEVVYADDGYQGARGTQSQSRQRAPLSGIEWRTAPYETKLKSVPALTRCWPHAKPGSARRLSIPSWSPNATMGSPRPAAAGSART